MKPTDIVCKCGNDWCFKCLKKAHRPIHCDMLNKWHDRIQVGNDDTDIWIKLNTKNCPKCKISIQKNQGCMHMTCSQCRYEFCWLCLGDYRNHSAETGRGLCNSFDDVVASGVSISFLYKLFIKYICVQRGKQEDIEEKMKLDMMLRKLDHYRTRYTEHFKAIAFA